MLKQKHILLYIAVFALILTGCSKTGGENLAARQESVVGADVTWEINGRAYSANVVLGDCGKEGGSDGKFIPATVTVTSPENISGLCIAFSADSAAASVGGVSFPLPDNMGREVYLIVKSLRPNQSERKGAGEAGGRAVLYEWEAFGKMASFDTVYGDDKYPISSKITWGETEIKVTYGNIKTAAEETK